MDSILIERKNRCIFTSRRIYLNCDTCYEFNALKESRSGVIAYFDEEIVENNSDSQAIFVVVYARTSLTKIVSSCPKKLSNNIW